ncbi:MAG: hypothetical protein WCR42_00945 [bacterium]
MQNLNIIFDTNAYRNLTFGLTEQQTREIFDKVRSEESLRNITSILSTVTLMELMTHLADKADPSYHHCKIAAIGAYHHVQEENNFRLLPHPELLLEQMLFQRVDTKQQESNLTLGRVAFAIHQGPADERILEYDTQIQGVKRIVEQHEQDFVDDILTVITQMDKDATNWKLFQNDKTTKTNFLKYLKTDSAVNILAGAFVVRTINNLNVQTLAEHDFINMVLEVARVFKTALTLYIKVMQRMTISGYNMTNVKKRRWNTIWDIYLLFCISDENIGGKETVFVTEEEWLHDVCAEIGRPNKIIKLADYKALLGV